MDDVPASLTLLERVKAQAEVLAPLVKRLESELGAERSHRIVREVLSSYFRSVAERHLRDASGDPVQALVRFGVDSVAGGAFRTDAVEGEAGEVNFDVTDCKYAQFYKSLGEPDLGFLLVCSMDYDVAEVLGIELTRTSTIMQGGGRCDFRWRIPLETHPKP